MPDSFFKQCMNFFTARFAAGIVAYLFFSAYAVFLANVFRLNNFFMPLDQGVLEYFASSRIDALTVLMRAVTFLGSAEAIIVFTIALLVWFAHKKMPVYFMALGTAIFGSVAMIFFMKHLFSRLRPPEIFHLIGEDNYSFPSGHAFLSLVFYGILMYFVMRYYARPRQKLFVLFVALFLIFTIGVSRLYLGVHWLSDILGSYAIGGAWLAIVIWLAKEKRIHA